MFFFFASREEWGGEQEAYELGDHLTKDQLAAGQAGWLKISARLERFFGD